MTHADLFPEADTVIELQPTPENRTHVAKIVGTVRPDWSNAIMMGHPVYLVDGATLFGYVPTRNALTGGLKTEQHPDGSESIICELRSFPLPNGYKIEAAA